MGWGGGGSGMEMRCGGIFVRGRVGDGVGRCRWEGMVWGEMGLGREICSGKDMGLGREMVWGER